MTIHFSRFGQVKSQGARKSQARAEDLYFYACSRAEDEMTRKPSGRSILGHREFQYTKASPSYTRANSAKIEPEPQYGADGSLSYFYESLEFRPLDSFFVPFHISYYMTKELFSSSGNRRKHDNNYHKGEVAKRSIPNTENSEAREQRGRGI